MNTDFKEVLSANCKWIFLLGGVILGLVLGATLMNFNRDLNLVELDLKKIIHTYSVATAKSKRSMDEIQKDFKAKFNLAMEQTPTKTIVVNKGSLLSKHDAIDYTKNFIEIMGINKINDQTSN